MRQQGFSVVELLVTIVIAGLFASAVFLLLNSVGVAARHNSQQVAASNLSYNNLRLYANGQKPLWFDCIGDEWNEYIPPFSDGTRAGATGQVLIERSTDENLNGMRGPVEEKVIAIAPYGCGESGSGLPIRVQSQVRYGPEDNRKEVTHATYVSY